MNDRQAFAVSRARPLDSLVELIDSVGQGIADFAEGSFELAAVAAFGSIRKIFAGGKCRDLFRERCRDQLIDRNAFLLGQYLGLAVE
jgi:hypothetical protein